MNIEELKNKIESGMDTEDAITALSEFLKENPDCEEGYILRGMRYWSLSQRGKALTDYLAAIRLNPDSKAKMLMQSANQILNFYNKDLYNP